MALFNTSKLDFDCNTPKNTQRGNYQWKYETQKEVIFVPDENGKFLIATKNEKDANIQISLRQMDP